MQVSKKESNVKLQSLMNAIHSKEEQEPIKLSAKN